MRSSIADIILLIKSPLYFEKGFFRYFKPLDNLIFNALYFLFVVFATDCTFPYKAYTPALFLVIFEVFCIAFFITFKLFLPEFLI